MKKKASVWGLAPELGAFSPDAGDSFNPFIGDLSKETVFATLTSIC